ncbi:MAG TPA: helix-turn-helix domain-containing protein [Micromonosporaceae bacterium]|nr:helix-turn-helix domain-containing protein [Micromonosporaceae bacterium]
MSRAQLAREMGVTPSRITQILSGDENLTLRTLGSLAACLDGRFVVELVPNGARAAAAPDNSSRSEPANSGR